MECRGAVRWRGGAASAVAVAPKRLNLGQQILFFAAPAPLQASATLMGNSTSVARISRLRGRGGLEPGAGGLGFGSRANPGGLEGANPNMLGPSRVARVVIGAISGVALLALVRAAATGNVHTERTRRVPA